MKWDELVLSCNLDKTIQRDWSWWNKMNWSYLVTEIRQFNWSRFDEMNEMRWDDLVRPLSLGKTGLDEVRWIGPILCNLDKTNSTGVD